VEWYYLVIYKRQTRIHFYMLKQVLLLPYATPRYYVEEFARSGSYACKIEPDTSNDNDTYSMGMGTVQYILEIMK